MFVFENFSEQPKILLTRSLLLLPPPFNISHRSQPQQEEKGKNSLFPPNKKKERGGKKWAFLARIATLLLPPRPHFFHPRPPPPTQHKKARKQGTTHCTIALECRGRRLFFLFPIPAHPFPSIHIHIALRQKISSVHFRTYTTFPDRKCFFSADTDKKNRVTLSRRV